VPSYNQYDTPTDFSGGAARILVDTINSNERFIQGIDCAESKFWKRWGTKLVLTDRRVIAIRSRLIGSSVEDYQLESISHVEFDASIVSGELTLSGAGFDSSYDVPKSMGSDFANEIRNRL